VAGDGARIVTRAHAGDLAEIVASVRDAKRQAQWVIVSSHTHEGAGSRWVPAEFLVEFARAVIDAGADAFVGHGPHSVRGVEIYRGKPIFYSLGMILSQSETAALQPHDNFAPYAGVLDPFSATPSEFYEARNAASGGGRTVEEDRWTSAFAVVDFRGGALREIRMYPVDLGFGLHRAVQGRPLLATGAMAGEILERLRSLSEPFGTRLEIENGVGVIRLPPEGTR
jgi:hypothetical protein